MTLAIVLSASAVVGCGDAGSGEDSSPTASSDASEGTADPSGSEGVDSTTTTASSGPPADSSGSSESGGQPVGPDFSAVDARLEQFVAEHAAFEGASIVIVDRDDGSIHRAAFGSYTLDTIVMLASTSKVPSATLLMAMADDEALDFEIDAPAEDYLSGMSVWPGVTAEHMLSNTSGIPGLQYVASYGAHLCQYAAAGDLATCGQTIYETPLEALPSSPPGVAFDYGGSQWQLAGAVAEAVGGQSWAALFDQYVAAPCQLEVFEYGNMWSGLDGWSGLPDSLMGRDNPNIEGGAISHIDDYAKLLMMHLHDGACGDTQVLSAESVAFMRIDRGTPAGSREYGEGAGSGMGYGMGWWVIPRDESEPHLFVDPGAFGAVSWIDTDRSYAGFVAIADYTTEFAGDASGMIITELVPLVEAAIDSGS